MQKTFHFRASSHDFRKEIGYWGFQVLRFGVLDFGFKVLWSKGSGFKVWDVKFWVQGLGLKGSWGVGFWAQGFG